MNKTMTGRIHGRTIELTDDPGLQDGQEVRVQMTPVLPLPANWGEGIRRSAGALANEWTEEDDRILEEIHQDRKRDSRPELPE
jgi:hypothetical protein